MDTESQETLQVALPNGFCKETVPRTSLIPFDLELATDPSFPQGERTKIMKTAKVFGSYVHHGLSPTPWGRVRVWVFPAERLHAMQPYIQTKPGAGDVFRYSSFQAGVSCLEYTEPPLVEVFLCIGEDRVPLADANRVCGHELAHALTGTFSEDLNLEENQSRLQCPPGVPRQHFRQTLKLLEACSLAPSQYVTRGLVKQLQVVTLEPRVLNIPLYGMVLYDLTTSLIGDEIAGEPSRLAQTPFGRFVYLVGERTLTEAYGTGNTRELASVFQAKTGYPFPEFSYQTDRAMSAVLSSPDDPKKIAVLTEVMEKFLGSSAS